MDSEGKLSCFKLFYMQVHPILKSKIPSDNIIPPDSKPLKSPSNKCEPQDLYSDFGRGTRNSDSYIIPSLYNIRELIWSTYSVHLFYIKLFK